MPAVNRQAGGFTFYNIFRGKFVRKAPDGYAGEDLVERVNHLGKAVRELHFDRLEDIILVDIKIEDHAEYGKSYNFYFIDGNEYIKLKVSCNSSVASGILVRLENIFLENKFAIQLYFFPKDNENTKDRTTLNIFQEDKKLERVYTKDNPGKLPQPIDVVINNKPELDWSDQLNYWSALIKDIASRLPGVHTETANVAQEQDTTPREAVQAPTSQSSPPMTPDEADDLPF